jgi:hypothetical protein
MFSLLCLLRKQENQVFLFRTHIFDSVIWAEAHVRNELLTKHVKSLLTQDVARSARRIAFLDHMFKVVAVCRSEIRILAGQEALQVVHVDKCVIICLHVKSVIAMLLVNIHERPVDFGSELVVVFMLKTVGLKQIERLFDHVQCVVAFDELILNQFRYDRNETVVGALPSPCVERCVGPTVLQVDRCRENYTKEELVTRMLT